MFVSPRILYVFFFIPCSQELELVEDVWRGEVQDLLSQINQLHTENKKLLVSLSLKEFPVPEEEQQQQGGGSPASTRISTMTTNAIQNNTAFTYHDAIYLLMCHFQMTQ